MPKTLRNTPGTHAESIGLGSLRIMGMAQSTSTPLVDLAAGAQDQLRNGAMVSLKEQSIRGLSGGSQALPGRLWLTSCLWELLSTEANTRPHLSCIATTLQPCLAGTHLIYADRDPELWADFPAWPQPCLGTNNLVWSLGCFRPWSLSLNLASEKKV